MRQELQAADDRGDEQRAAVTSSVVGTDLLFVSPGWAHDLGNSLQAASLYLEVLKLQLDSAGADRATSTTLTALAGQLERIQRLVSVWVGLSVPTTSSEASAFDLHELLSDLALLLSVTLRHRGLTLQVACPQGVLGVRGDRFSLLHIGLCLLAGVLEATPAARGATLTATTVDRCTARCLIAANQTADADPPIADFDRSEPVLNTQAMTLGPGIAFALQTLECHRGRLRMLDVAGRPQAFWFDLPLADEIAALEIEAALGG